MFNYHPGVKIVAVFLVCLLLANLNYLLLETSDSGQFSAILQESHLIRAGLVPYVFVVLLFCDYYWRKGLFLVFSVWVVFNLAIVTNGIMYALGHTPPLYLQYSQSTSLMIFNLLLLATRFKFPNWLRIFSCVNLLVLVPCVIFYFKDWWEAYGVTIYLLCFTPMIKALVFLQDHLRSRPEVIDAD